MLIYGHPAGISAPARPVAANARTQQSYDKKMLWGQWFILWQILMLWNGYATSSLKLIFDADNSIRCVPNYKTKSGRAGWNVCFNRLSRCLWSGRRGSNSLPPPWQGGALPDELRPHKKITEDCSVIFLLAAPVRLERTTPWLTVRCSNQLSYGAIFNLSCQALSLTTPLL